MSRLFGTFTQVSGPVAPLLSRVGEHARVAAGENRHGYGLGSSNAGEILLQRRPQVRDQALDMRVVAADIRSTAFVGHVRRAVVGGPTVDNTQPFRFGPWMFAQVGTLPCNDTITRGLRAHLPDSLAHNVHGETDAELLFHLILSQLQDAGASPRSWAIEPALVALAIRQALLRWHAAAREAGDERTPELALLLASGQSFFALAHGHPLWWMSLHPAKGGYAADDAQSLDAPQGERRLDRAGACVFVDGAGAPDDPSFVSLPDRTVAHLDRDLVLRWQPLG